MPRSYELPDGRKVTLKEEPYLCGEALFSPESTLTVPAYGLGDGATSTIRKCDADIQADLYGNVALAGGGSMFPDIDLRMVSELRMRATAQDVKVSVIADSKRSLLAWRGGSVLASLSTFQRTSIAKEEYDESGPSIVSRKCY